MGTLLLDTSIVLALREEGLMGRPVILHIQHTQRSLSGRYISSSFLKHLWRWTLDGDTFSSGKKLVDILVWHLHTFNSLLLVIIFNGMKCTGIKYSYKMYTKSKFPQCLLESDAFLGNPKRKKSTRFRRMWLRGLWCDRLPGSQRWAVMTEEISGMALENVCVDNSLGPNMNPGKLIIICIRSLACRKSHNL